MVFTTPAIRAVRRRFPDAQLAYIVEPAAAPVVLHNPHLDDVIVTPRARGLRGVIADIALGRRLNAARYDVAIDFHGGPRASLLTWLSGAPCRRKNLRCLVTALGAAKVPAHIRSTRPAERDRRSREGLQTLLGLNLRKSVER